MNRVRIVALAAAGLGVAVFAGTYFQPQGEALIAAAPPPQPAAPVSLVAAPPAAATTVPLRADPAPVTFAGSDPVGALADDASVTRASILPGVATADALPQARTGAVMGTALTADLDVNAVSLPPPGFAPLPEPAAADPQALDADLQAELDSCAVWVVVTPAAGAMLDLSVYAPCDQGADVAVTHAGLTVDARLGSDGQLAIMVPALSEDATLEVQFADGRSQSDTTFVPDFAEVERIALQWQGPATLLLHAYEFGATYGDEGHVHAANPMAPGLPGRGFLTALGDPAIAAGRLAQVYSYPVGPLSRTGSVVLEIEAPVTDASCGRSIEASTLGVHGGAAGQARAIVMDMPACDGAGGYVVLPGVLPDLRIAMN